MSDSGKRQFVVPQRASPNGKVLEKCAIPRFVEHLAAKKGSAEVVQIGGQDSDRQGIDAVIRVNGQEVAVQVWGYAPPQDRGEVATDDYKFREEMKRAIGDDLTELAGIHVYYKRIRRELAPHRPLKYVSNTSARGILTGFPALSPGSAAEIFKVPRPSEHQKLAAKVVELVRGSGLDRPCKCYWIKFVHPRFEDGRLVPGISSRSVLSGKVTSWDETSEEMECARPVLAGTPGLLGTGEKPLAPGQDRSEAPDADRKLKLSTWFEQFLIATCDPPSYVIKIDSNLSIGPHGLDEEFLRCGIQRKIDNPIKHSVDRPYWLLIVSGGVGTNTSIPDRSLKEGYGIVAHLLQDQSHRFDAAYWLDGWTRPGGWRLKKIRIARN